MKLHNEIQNNPKKRKKLTGKPETEELEKENHKNRSSDRRSLGSDAD